MSPTLSSSRLAALLAAAAASIAVAPPAASAQGGLRLAPSVVDAHRVRPGTTLGPIAVHNSSDRRLALSAAFVRAGQDLSGMPVYATSRNARAAGARIVRVTPGRITLAPGETRQVRVRVLKRPRGAAAAYGVVVFEARVAGRTRAARGAVAIPRLRIGANMLIHFPGAKRATVAVDGVRVAAARSGGAPEVVTRVRGTGNTDLEPQGRITIADAAGRRRARMPLPRGTVLPGAERDLAVELPRKLRAGAYTASVTLKGGGTKTSAFRLIAPGRLAASDLRIVSVDAKDDDDHVRGSVIVTNKGSSGGSGAVEVALAANDGGALARRQLDVGQVSPGGSKTIEFDLPAHGKPGAQVLVTLSDKGARLDRSEAVVERRVGGQASVQDWMAAHIPVVVAGFAALLLAAMAAMGAWAARLKRRVAGAAGSGA